MSKNQPSPHIRGTKKTQLRADSDHVSVFVAGTKLSANLQSQNVREQNSVRTRLQESRAQRKMQDKRLRPAVNCQIALFCGFFGAADRPLKIERISSCRRRKSASQLSINIANRAASTR